MCTTLSSLYKQDSPNLTKPRWVSYSELITGEDKHFQTDFKTLSNSRIKKSENVTGSITNSSWFFAIENQDHVIFTSLQSTLGHL